MSAGGEYEEPSGRQSGEHQSEAEAEAQFEAQAESIYSEEVFQLVAASTRQLLEPSWPKELIEQLLLRHRIHNVEVKKWTQAEVDFLEESLADLKPSIQRFTYQLTRMAEKDRRFPCIVDGVHPPTPIDPTGIPDYDLPFSRNELGKREVLPKFDLTQNKIIEFSPGETAEHFGSGLIDFLFTRFSDGLPKSKHRYTFNQGGPGLVFKVTTNTPGHSIHYTHQYYINPAYVFGAPSTPVMGHMHPGRWHFGTSQNSGLINWDLNSVYDVPRVYEAHIAV